MIGRIRRDNSAFPSNGLCHPQSDVIGFRPCAGHDCRIERGVHGRRQPLNIVQHTVMQIPRMRVQRRRLPRNRLDHLRITVPNVRYVIVAIEVIAPVSIPQPNALPPNKLHRVVIECRHIRAHQAGAISDQVGGVAGHLSLGPRRLTVNI